MLALASAALVFGALGGPVPDAAAAATPWTYVCPVPGSTRVSPANEIVFPDGRELDAGSVAAARVLVVGTTSGVHVGRDHTSVRFDLPRAARVRLGVFDVRGRRIETLLDGDRPAGRHVLPWAPRLPNGIYYLRMDADGVRRDQKVVLLR